MKLSIFFSINFYDFAFDFSIMPVPIETVFLILTWDSSSNNIQHSSPNKVHNRHGTPLPTILSIPPQIRYTIEPSLRPMELSNNLSLVGT